MTTTTQTPSRSRRTTIGLVAAGLLGVLTLGVIALSTAHRDAALDPRGTGPSGARALVEVLRAHGVTVEIVERVEDLASADPGPGSSVVVGNSEYLGRAAAAEVVAATRRADRLVLLDLRPSLVDAMDLPFHVLTRGAETSLTGHCDSDVARSSDTVGGSDILFLPTPTASGAADPGLTACFPGPPAETPSPSGSTGPARPESLPDDFRRGVGMVQVAASARHTEIVAIGFMTALTNESITGAAHAGVAVRALGHSPTLYWYQPSIVDLGPDGGAGDSETVWPQAVAPVAGLLLLASILLGITRGRRLGRLVPEPLPVIVRAVETTEARGRLYRRAADPGRAGRILREASLHRLRVRLALPPSTPATAVADLAATTAGMPPADVAALLTGPLPVTDSGLLTLARQLATLEEEVRRP